MAVTFSERDLARDLVQELASALEAVAGESVAVTPGAAASGTGWSATATVSGARQGTFALWIDASGAGAIAKLIVGGEETPDNPSIVDALKEMWSQAAGSLCQKPQFAGLKLTVSGPVAADAPAGDPHRFAMGLAAAGAAQVSVAGSLNVEVAPKVEERTNLDLVLDIELPLTVRFGRAVMSLQSLAEMGPGSVVDMGRSPDDPVELLISDRVFAKGEVVVVGGNYGVRVTDLVGSIGKPRSAET